jgi:hypothetical protein
MEKKIIKGLRLGLGSQGIWTPELEEIILKEKLKHQLFIGKVSDVIGFEKTIELLKEVNNEIK